MKLIGNKGYIYVGPHNLEVHRNPTKQEILEYKKTDTSGKPLVGCSFEAPLSELAKWIESLEINSTEDGGIQMGNWD